VHDKVVIVRKCVVDFYQEQKNSLEDFYVFFIETKNRLQIKLLFIFLKVFKRLSAYFKSSNTEFSIFLFIAIIFIFCNVTYLNVPMFKILNKYFMVVVLLYTLLTGFIFLKKSYQYGKYTSQIQRF